MAIGNIDLTYEDASIGDNMTGTITLGGYKSLMLKNERIAVADRLASVVREKILDSFVAGATVEPGLR